MNQVKTVKDRIDLYLHITHKTVTEMCAIIGRTRQWWQQSKNPTVEDISKVLKEYQEISAEWLMRGEGQMIKGEAGEVSISHPVGKSEDASINYQYNGGKYSDEYVQDLKNQIEYLKKMNEELSKNNTKLTEKLLSSL